MAASCAAFGTFAPRHALLGHSRRHCASLLTASGDDPPPPPLSKSTPKSVNEVEEAPMSLLDYGTFFGTIAGFMVFFYAVAAVFKR